MNGLMKGIIKTGVIFSAVLVAALFVFYIIPAFAAGATLTVVSPTPTNNSNVSTVGAQGYFYVNISLSNNSVSSPNLEVYNLSVAGSQFMNFTMTNSTNNNVFNYTFFNVTGLSNGTFTWRVVGINVSEGLGANQTFGNFTVTLGQIYNAVITNPSNSTNTANDLTPEIRVSANSTFLTNLSLTLYTNKAGVIQAVRNLTITNGTETAFNLTQLTDGTYNIIAEVGNSADFKVNSTALTIVVTYLEANATLDVSSVLAGAEKNYTFTVANNGTDTIDRINITYDANFEDPVAGDIVCPTTTSIWNRSVDAANNMLTCIMPDRAVDSGITSGNSKTIKVENWSAPNDARVKTFLVDVRGLKNGNSSVVASMPSVSVFGNLTVTGINRASAVNQTGTTNLTMITFDVNATGEAMNITGINITINGTIQESDIVRVGLYNSTFDWVTTLNSSGAINLLQWNNSGPVAGGGNTLRYNFSNIALIVNVSQKLIVVINLSSTAVGGRTFNVSIETNNDVVTTGGHSGQAITETLATQRSGTTTVYGTLSVTGTSRAASTTQIGTSNVTVITFNLTAVGEQMNVSEIIVTRNGTSITDADIVEVKLFNTTDPAATVVNSTQTPLAVNTSAPTNGRYNFSGLSLKVPTGATGQIILVSFNISSSATGGRTFNASIEGAADIVTNASVSGAAIVETLATPRSDSSTIYGTLALTGGSRVASSIQIGATNITVISFNFTATGETINITGLNITFNGTLLSSDIERVGIFNNTAANAGVYNETTYDLIKWNISSNVSVGVSTIRYNFSNIAFNISAGTTNVLVVVVNMSEAARAGRTFNASIEGVADVISTGVSSGVALTETFTSQRSASSTIKGNFSVTGTKIAPSAADVGQIGVGILRLTLNATGEAVNVTTINITSNNTRNQDILAVRLFDDRGGVTAGTYDRGLDLPIAGTTGVFGGTSGGTVLITPTSPINVTMNTLHYVYVVFDINTSATLGADRLGASINGSAAIVATGNDSYIALTSQLLTGDLGAISTDIRNLTATSSVIVTGTAITRTGAGTHNNFTFTINNTATGSLTDSIDEIRILFGGTGFNLSGNATCPTISTVAWNRTILGANTIVCNVTDSGGRIAIDTNTTVLVENFTAGQTAGIYQMNISVRGASGGNFNVSSNPTITAYGNITAVGVDRVNTTAAIGTRITILSINLSATGEAANVSELLVTLNGTNLAAADIAAVELYNSTDKSTTMVNGSQTLMRTNVTPAVPSLTYNFSGLNLSVPTGVTGQVVLVVVNVSGSATGGRTINASVMGNGNMVTTTALTAVNIAENFTLVNSSSTTIYGNLSVLGASRVSSTTGIGTGNVTIISFNFTATGEAINITGINITLNGTGLTNADIANVMIYNSSNVNASVYDGVGVNYDLIQRNLSAPVAGAGGSLRYNFSNIAFNLTAGTPNVLLVVVNVSSSATGGRTFNASIEAAADVIATSVSSAQSITASLSGQRSSSSTVTGTLAVAGTSRVASWTRPGVAASSNVTVMTFNFTSTAEQMNISEIIVTRNGTGISNADIVQVRLYNTTDPTATALNETQTALAVNTSAPTNGRYNFSGLSFKVPTGATGQIVLVVFNISSSATLNRTFNVSIEAAGDIATIGSATGAAITETLSGQRSASSNLVGINISMTSLAPNNISANQTIGAMLNISVFTGGETMNISSFNFTLTGNATTGNVTDVRLYRDDAAPLGQFTDADTFLTARGTFNGNSIQLNLTPTLNYNLSVRDGTTNFFVTYNISGGARAWATVGTQIIPSGVAAVGNASGLAITVTGNSFASSNATVQSEASLSIGTTTTSQPWITNKTTNVNSTTIGIPVTNGGLSTANLTSVLLTFLNTQTAENASTNFTVVRADSVTAIAGGVTTTLNFTINSTTASQLVGRVNTSVRLIYNDSNTYAAVTAGAAETNSSGLFGLDGVLPTSQIVLPSNGGSVNNSFDINFTINDTGSGINSSTLKFYVNSVPRNATCASNQLNFTCNFTFSSADPAYVFGSNTAYVNVSDNATNAATRSEVNFTVTNVGGTANYTYPTSGTFPTGWNTMFIPHQSIIETTGRNASTTGDFNFTSIMSSLGTSWNLMYYNTNGTSTGWVLATRTDFAGSTLKYLNNTNDKPYYINITITGMTFKL